MSKDDSSFSDAGVVLSVRSPCAQRDISVRTVVKVRSRWPFTVQAVYGSTKRRSADALPAGQKDSSFVT